MKSQNKDESLNSIVVEKFGGYEVLKIRNFPLPEFKDCVEVKVHYCGLNFADLYSRQGLIPREVPFVLGMECSGIVQRSEFPEFKIGDKVLCYNYQGGLYGDVVRVAAKNCYQVPDHVNLETAAAIFVNYLTAYFSLFSIGNLQPEQSVFIPSCHGGLGIAASQLASTVKSVTLYGTSSKDCTSDIVRIIKGDLDTSLSKHCPDGFDVILETQAGTDRNVLEKHLKALGKIVYLGINNVVTDTKRISTMAMLKMWWNRKSLSEFDIIMNNRIVGGLHLGLLTERCPDKVRGALNQIFELLKEEKIKPRIHAVMKFEDIVDATKLLAERKNIGKVLLKLDL